MAGKPVLSHSSAADDMVCLLDSARKAIGIETEKVKQRECNCVLKAMGKILAPQSQKAIVSHAFPARIAEIHVRVGDWVEKGQPLVTLESQDVGEAKSEFYKAAAGCELAKLNFEREKRLSENGIGVKKNLLAAEAEYKVSQASVEAAEKRLHVLGFTEEQVKEIAQSHQINPTITLYAPIAGKLVECGAVRGAMVDQSTEILTIIDPSLLWVDAQIYEKDIAKIEIGQEVEITVPAYPQQVFQGKISYIGDIVDDQTRTITVRTEVANDRQQLKPGMFADVKIILQGKCEMLVVPSAAILEGDHEEIVFVKAGDGFARRAIQTGFADGDYRQVVKGLIAGEEIVVQGNHELNAKLKEEVLQAGHVH
jgi:cobalt-zinc-cadmium efflux system membrane fusion protein